ncbi:MAG TPA: phosphate regulon transcriptional regulator PhoB [Gammaproteobacteria bacterium]|nr:phosphate regulon transcriptional regulator PhoB [Gammaproteobacteria bacterium]
MSTKRILIVEDEAAIREMVGFVMRRAGYELSEAATGREAQQQIGRQLPDIILMDWMLPDVSGVELVRRFKRDELTGGIPIIMLTARSEEDDKVQGLDAGADDYMTKPFSSKELVARIRAVLRRGEDGQQEQVMQVGALHLDSASHRVLAGDREIPMGPTEFRLLQFFMSHQDRVFSRAQLLDHIWGRNAYVEDRTVDVHVLRLRKLLKPYNLDNLIQTVRGSGYRFSAR